MPTPIGYSYVPREAPPARQSASKERRQMQGIALLAAAVVLPVLLAALIAGALQLFSA